MLQVVAHTSPAVGGELQVAAAERFAATDLVPVPRVPTEEAHGGRCGVARAVWQIGCGEKRGLG